jgi:hypothetical protein
MVGPELMPIEGAKCDFGGINFFEKIEFQNTNFSRVKFLPLDFDNSDRVLHIPSGHKKSSLFLAFLPSPMLTY